MMKLKFAPAQKIYYKKVFFASSFILIYNVSELKTEAEIGN